jgi:AbrB family looped-hinge helix DNA binding protein
MFTAKITKKGQVTIPAEFRKKLKTDVVKIEMKGDRIIIQPYRKLGGIFHKYAIKDKSIEEIMKMEKEAYFDAIKERYSGNRR